MVRSPRSCEGTPLKLAPTVLCARTSLAVTASNDAREALCVRATASRHVAWRARWLAAHERREGLAHAPVVGGDLGVGLG